MTHCSHVFAATESQITGQVQKKYRTQFHRTRSFQTEPTKATRSRSQEPYFSQTARPQPQALERFDFSGGGSSSISEVLAEADLYDMVSLWHLLSRVPKTDRGAVFDELSKFVGPPAGVTREGIIALDKNMLEVWLEAVEAAWFS